MRCFQLIETDDIEARIPVQSQDGQCFIDLGDSRTVEVDSSVLDSDLTNGFIERASIEFLDGNPVYKLVPETKIDSDQALLLLPPTNRFSYVSLSEDKCDLTSSSKYASLLLILQPGNRILVTPQATDVQLVQWVVEFDGENITSKPLNNQ